jgi:hypothetical protein
MNNWNLEEARREEFGEEGGRCDEGGKKEEEGRKEEEEGQADKPEGSRGKTQEAADAVRPSVSWPEK